MLTVMTWNVENLFLPGSPSGPKTQQIYDAKLAGLAAKINAIKPDGGCPGRCRSSAAVLSV